MLKRYGATPLLCLFLGGICLSASPGYYSDDSYQPGNYYQNPYSQNNNSYSSDRPGISNDSSPSSSQSSARPTRTTRKRVLGQDEVANQEEISHKDDDELEKDIRSRANRKGDWGFRENWRYDSKAFLRGETQGEAYLQEHPYGPGGIGYDADNEYLDMRKVYKEDIERQKDWEKERDEWQKEKKQWEKERRDWEKEHQRSGSNANQRSDNKRSSDSSNGNRGYDKNSYSSNQSNPSQKNNTKSSGKENSKNSAYAGNQKNANRSSNNKYANCCCCPCCGGNCNSEVAYINQTNAGYPYYNDPDNNWQYDESKRNASHNYRSMEYDPYYYQEDPTAHSYYYYY